MDKKILEIISIYQENIKNVREALSLAGVPDALVEVYTLNFPDLNKMLPEAVVSLYKDVRTLTIVYLHLRGLSLREIAKRIGSSHMLVKNVLENNNIKPNVISPDEVSQSTPLEVETDIKK